MHLLSMAGESSLPRRDPEGKEPAPPASQRARVQRSLRRKLFFSYAFLVLGVLGGGGWSIYQFAILGHSVRLIMSNNYRSVVDAQNMKETLERQDSAMQFHIAGYDDKAVRQYFFNRRRFAERYDDAAHNITEVGEPEAIRDIGLQFAAYSRLDQAFLRNHSPPARQARVYFGTLEPAFLRLKNRCDDLLNLNQDAMVRAQRRAERRTRWATEATITLALAALLIGVAYSVQLSTALVAPLNHLAAAAKRVSEGDLDLSIAVHTGDEVELLAQEFNHMAGSLREYREREAARLQVAEEKSDAAINSLYEPVIVTGPKGEVIALNRAAEPLFGTEAHWMNQPVEYLGVDTLSAAIRKAIEQRAAVALEGDRGLASLSVNHSERSYRVRTAPLLRPDPSHSRAAGFPAGPGGGNVAGTVTVLEDVTRLRQLDQLKDDFISVASHELRTPLTSMLMAVHLLAEGSAGALAPPQERLVRMAAADAERLDRLTKDLLDLTRLEAGTAVPHRRPIRPADIVASALEPLRPQAAEKAIALEVHVPPSLSPVSGDREQLSRVVGNLVSNALRHTPPGGRVTVSASDLPDRRQPAPSPAPTDRSTASDSRPAPAATDAVLHFAVSDTGEGIPPSYLSQVFERFVQVPGTSAGGAGLGLPIARKIVEAHGGTITVESAPSRGTTFRFTIPLAPAVSASRGPTQKVEEKHGPRPNPDR